MLTNTKPRLRRAEASAYLLEHHGIERKPSTLAKLACIGGSPAFQKANRIPYYSPSDLDAWAESVLSEKVRSTSELAMPPVSDNRNQPQ